MLGGGKFDLQSDIVATMNEKRKRGRPKYDDVLTPAEWRVVEAIRHGMTNPQIAERRNISIDAVKYHVSNALLKLGLDNRTQLRSWDGIAKVSVLSDRETSMTENEKTIGLGAISQISRHVSNISLATYWFANILGLKHLYSFGEMAFFDCGGVRLFLSQSEGDPPADSIVYFEVVDIHAAYKNMESRGVLFLGAPHMVHKHDDGTEEWMAFFKDLDDRPLAITARQKKN